MARGPQSSGLRCKSHGFTISAISASRKDPRPAPGPDEILVRARACGICSGDIMPWYIRRKAPLVLGHEPVGVVEEVGAAVREFRRGERVFVHHHAPCFECAACRRGEYVQCATWRATKIVPGGMAEYFLVSAHNQRDTLRLPDAIGDADGVLIEPAACVVKSLTPLGPQARRESILIIGLGIMGMMHVKLARHLGAGHDHRRRPVRDARAARDRARRGSRDWWSRATTWSSRCAR